MFSLPWKERTIPYPPRKTNKLLVFVRVGSNPVWLYKGKERCRWLRGDFRIASLKGRQGGGIDCLLLGAQEGSCERHSGGSLPVSVLETKSQGPNPPTSLGGLCKPG